MITIQESHSSWNKSIIMKHIHTYDEIITPYLCFKPFTLGKLPWIDHLHDSLFSTSHKQQWSLRVYGVHQDFVIFSAFSSTVKVILSTPAVPYPFFFDRYTFHFTKFKPLYLRKVITEVHIALAFNTGVWWGGVSQGVLKHSSTQGLNYECRIIFLSAGGCNI